MMAPEVLIVGAAQSPATTVACAKARSGPQFDGHARGECENCGTGIMFRPDTPAHLEKLCFSCALEPFNFDPEA